MPSPIAHSLMGACLYAERTPERRERWTLLAVSVIAANAPDLDFIPGILIGEPLAFHRQMGHSLVFCLFLAGLTYLVARFLNRRMAGAITRAAVFGLLSHLALDYFCAPTPAKGIAFLWPFVTERVCAPFSIFPFMTRDTIFNWQNVQAAIGEIVVMMAFVLPALRYRLRDSYLGRPLAPRSAPDRAGPALETVED